MGLRAHLLGAAIILGTAGAAMAEETVCVEQPESFKRTECLKCRDLQHGTERGWGAQSFWPSGGMVPTSGCHSTIESPESVSRVTPPTTTMANTRAQQPNNQAAMDLCMMGLG